MITYEDYEKIRNSKGMKDSDVAKAAGFHQSVLSDWKRNKSRPKADKMQKIAEALDVDYFAFIGPVGLHSAYRLNDDILKSQQILIEATDKLKIPKMPEYLTEYIKRISELSATSRDKLDDYLKFLESMEKKQ